MCIYMFINRKCSFTNESLDFHFQCVVRPIIFPIQFSSLIIIIISEKRKNNELQHDIFKIRRRFGGFIIGQIIRLLNGTMKHADKIHRSFGKMLGNYYCRVAEPIRAVPSPNEICIDNYVRNKMKMKMKIKTKNIHINRNDSSTSRLCICVVQCMCGIR